MDPVINKSQRFVPVAQPWITEAEAAALRATADRNWISQGPVVDEFEHEFAAAHGKAYGVACCSGTSALQLAMAAMGMGQDDLILTPTLTMVAVPNAVRYVGARPVFGDSGPDGNLCESELSASHSATIVPHLYGRLARWVPRARNRRIVEDCAEAHYATYSDGKKAGEYAEFACFSFYANKIVTTGEGGMVLTNDQGARDLLVSLRSHAFTEGEHFRHKGLAYGMRMTDMQAAVGLAQHRRREEILQRRAEAAALYTARLERVSPTELTLPRAPDVWWVYPIVCRGRDALRQALADQGVETRTYFIPMHEQPHLRRFGAARDYPVATKLSRTGLYLPLYPTLSREIIELITDTICEFYGAQNANQD